MLFPHTHANIPCQSERDTQNKIQILPLRPSNQLHASVRDICDITNSGHTSSWHRRGREYRSSVNELGINFLAGKILGLNERCCSLEVCEHHVPGNIHTGDFIRRQWEGGTAGRSMRLTEVGDATARPAAKLSILLCHRPISPPATFSNSQAPGHQSGRLLLVLCQQSGFFYLLLCTNA